MDSVIWLSKHVYAYLLYVSYYNTDVSLQQYIQNTETRMFIFEHIYIIGDR